MAFAGQSTTPERAGDCGCTTPFRTFAGAPNADQRALFAAARRADVETFMRLLPLAGDLGEVALNGQPILAAIILPDPELKSDDKQWGWTKPPQRDRLFQAHRSTLDARLRMLRAALAHGARPNDLTYEYRIPPLQLAIVLGSPDMVDELLKGGADPTRANEDRQLTPLEFLLDHEFFMRMRRVPEMLTRDERARIVASLLRAGSPQPRTVDWTDLVSLVAGDTWLLQLLAQYKPEVEDLQGLGLQQSPTAAAAYLGDELALRALLKNWPQAEQTASEPLQGEAFDRVLDAAIAAILGGHSKLALSLLNPRMNWSQSGPQGNSRMGKYLVRDPEDFFTALEAAVARSDAALVNQLLDWGAPMGSALDVAVRGRDETMVRLLIQKGANPAKQPESGFGDSPLQSAVRHAPELLPALLLDSSAATRESIKAHGEALLLHVFEHHEASGVNKPALIESLFKVGLSGRELSPAVLDAAILSGDIAAVEALSAGGAPWPGDALSSALSVGHLPLVQQVSKLSGQALRNSCPQDVYSLTALVREGPPFADSLLDQGLPILECGTPESPSGPLSHRLLSAWVAPDSRPLMEARYQRARALLQRIWQADPSQRQLPQGLWQGLVSKHRPDVLALALEAQPVSQTQLGVLAYIALDELNPQALGQMRAFGLQSGTPLPTGKTLGWHLGCGTFQAWRAEAGFSDLPALKCSADPIKPTQPIKPAGRPLAKGLTGTYFLSGVREVGSELTLRSDGRFSLATSFGAVDELLEGRWSVEGTEVVLQSTDAVPSTPVRLRKAWYEAGDDGIHARAALGERWVGGFLVMLTGSERDVEGKLSSREEDGWTRFPGVSPYLGALKGLAVATTDSAGLRWSIIPISADERGQAPNRIELEVNPSILIPPARTIRMRIHKGELVSGEGEEIRGRYKRARRH